MSNIGPNFRPPGQQMPSTGARQPASPETTGPNASNHAPGSLPNMPGGTLPLLSPQALLAPLFAHQNAISSEQLVLLLRNLLQMPQEMVQLLAMFANLDAEVGQQLLKQLLSQSAPIPLETLQQFLQTHLGKAQGQLIKLMQSSQMPLTGASGQMGELISVMSELAAKTGKSPTEALQTTLNLYLPYYPLHPPQALNLRFETGGSAEEEGSEDSNVQLALFIETLGMGLFKITLSAEGQGRYQALAEHDPMAEPYLPTIEQNALAALGAGSQQMLTLAFMARQQTGQPSIQADPVEMTSTPEESTTGAAQSVGIHPMGGVSAGLICVAYVFIRVIFELDNQQHLQQKRPPSI